MNRASSRIFLSRFPASCLLLCIQLVFAGSASGQSSETRELQATVNRLQTELSAVQARLALLETGKTSTTAEASPAPGTSPVCPVPSLPPATQPEVHSGNVSASLYIGEATMLHETANEQEDSVPRINNELLDPSMRGFVHLPGVDTALKIDGYVKTDFFYDLNYAGSYYGGYSPSSFPSQPQPHSPDTTLSARASRLALTIMQPAFERSVKVYFEMDAFGANRTALRMRHFYGQYGNLLAGQTWTAFGDADVFPNSLEFFGPPGIIGIRQPQIRYSHPFNYRFSSGISVERTDTDAPRFAVGSPYPTAKWPDLVLFSRLETTHGHFQPAFLFRSIGGVLHNAGNPALEEHRAGYGTSLSGAYAFRESLKDNVVFQGVIGRGISTYYNDNTGLQSDLGSSANGGLTATASGSMHAGYTHRWSSVLLSTVAYGILDIKNAAQDPGTNYHFSNYSLANLIVQPKVNYLFGAEFIYGSLERKDGFTWRAPRVQASMTYYFNRYPRE